MRLERGEELKEVFVFMWSREKQEHISGMGVGHERWPGKSHWIGEGSN